MTQQMITKQDRQQTNQIMKNILKNFSLLIAFILLSVCVVAQHSFVRVQNGKFYIGNKPYYFKGMNYWYGGLLATGEKKEQGKERLKKELDFLSRNGVTNLRVLVGSEGTGKINGVQRVHPSLQPTQNEYDTALLYGLDYLLSEMNQRNMKAILFFSNTWEWSGGWLQYLQWNGKLADSTMRRKLNWDELRDIVSGFFACDACKKAYYDKVKFIISRTNTVTGKKYIEDPAIMSWEPINEPRPMRPAVNALFLKWASETSALIRSLDQNHLITTGCEGDLALDNNMPLYKSLHADKNIDYLTIHIWPKNWGWFHDTAIVQGYPTVEKNLSEYLTKHISVAREMKKPLVVEEFGLPRDGHSFDIHSSTVYRDKMFKIIFDRWDKSRKKQDVLAGWNVWTFSGIGRAGKDPLHWTMGDDMLGDPPQEEQGLNSVFDTDKRTWSLIRSYK